MYTFNIYANAYMHTIMHIHDFLMGTYSYKHIHPNNINTHTHKHMHTYMHAYRIT